LNAPQQQTNLVCQLTYAAFSKAHDDWQPSCSAAESLNRQHAFINQTLANHALALLNRLFRFGRLQYHGGFVSLASGAAVPLRIDPKVWARIRARDKRLRSAGATLV
jgi:hypothetical protein